MQNKCLIKIASVFKTSLIIFPHNFLFILSINILLKQYYLKYVHSTATFCLKSFWLETIFDFFSNNFYLPLSLLYNDTSTFLEQVFIYKILPYSILLKLLFLFYFFISNKSGIKEKDQDSFIKKINSSLEYFLESIFLFTDGSATLSSSYIYLNNQSYKKYQNFTNRAVVLYTNRKVIGFKYLRLLFSFTAFDTKLFLILKALQILKTKLSSPLPSKSNMSINKVFIYTNSSFLLKFLSKNLSNFLHHISYIKTYYLINLLLLTHLSLSFMLS